jgi:hypothetical protein
MTPEERARRVIDAMLTASGRLVRSKDAINLSVSRGDALRELPFMGGEAHQLFGAGLPGLLEELNTTLAA